jgi:hypothetical protein
MSTSLIPRPVLMAMTAGATVLAVAVPASAQTTTVTDRRGDARPAIDLTRARYVNRDDVVWARLKVRDLRWRGSFSLYVSAGDPEEATVAVTITARRDHSLRRDWAVMSRGGSRPLTCPGGVRARARYRPRQDVVSFSVRRSCIPDVEGNPIEAMVAESVIWTKDGVASYDDIGQRFVRHD